MDTLRELFSGDGFGVMATASGEGRVNTAVYARPHVLDRETVAWGMTAGRTYDNIMTNPFASYLFRQSTRGYSGARLDLKLVRVEHDGALLDLVKANTARIVSHSAAEAVKYVAIFELLEIRPLI